ncbi:MAG TPA: DUF4384 domain-containing protein [candidate division Zixibacteria bacterium]|nr:DUF4384 domain-containing protein [candidate division Zixibacteria bacterium]
MKRHKIITAMILAVLMLASTAMAQVYHTPPGQRGQREPLDIEVWTNKEEGGSFGQGENLVIYFRTNRDAFVTIYDLDTKGNINLLYPYDYRDENFVEGGVVYTIPDYYDDYVLRVNGPPGLEFVQAIASDRDFMVPDWEYNFRDRDGWREIDNEREALAYLEYINHKYFPVENCVLNCDMDYTFFEVRKNWQYSWDSYYYDDYSYYDDVHVVHHYHPYYYRPIYYDPWWDPWDWCGTMYIGYPIGGAIWINGIFYGYAPLFIPRLSIGWWDVRIVHGGTIYYHDKVKIRRGLSHELYHAGDYKWKTSSRASAKYNSVAQKHYPKTKSLSYKSAAKYTAGGKSGKTYTSGSSGKYSKDGTAVYKSRSGTQTKSSRESFGTKSSKGATDKTGTKGGSKYGKSYSGSSKSPAAKSGSPKTSVSGDRSKGSKETGSRSGTSKSGTYDKGSSSKSSKSGGASKTDKNRKSYEPSARFQKKGERSSYGTSDYGRSSNRSSSSYGKSSSGRSESSYGRSSSDMSSGSYDRSSSNRSSKSSSGYRSSGSSSRSSSKGSTYSRGSSGSRSSGSSGGSYKGSSGSRSSGSSGSKSSGSSGSKSSGSSSRKGK